MLDTEIGRLGRPDLARPLRELIEVSGDVSVLDKAAKILAGAGSAGLEYLRKIADLLDAYGVSRKDYAFDMGVVRGLDYYTGMVFEIDSPNLGAEKQVGGGGAYNLAEVFGGERIAQTGVALGLDRLCMPAEGGETIEPRRPLHSYILPARDGVPGNGSGGLRCPGAPRIRARPTSTESNRARCLFMSCRNSSRRISRTCHGPRARVCISSNTHRSSSLFRTGGTFVTTYRHTRSSRTWCPQWSSVTARPFCPHGYRVGFGRAFSRKSDMSYHMTGFPSQIKVGT